MFNSLNISSQLEKIRTKNRKHEDILLNEVKNILGADLLKENKILNHLKFYNQAFELVDETEVDYSLIYTLQEIKKTCVNYRLRFLDSQHYKNEIPYEAVLKIKDFNAEHRKDLKRFKILAPVSAFIRGDNNLPCLLFAETLNGNYYLIHAWGQDFKWYRALFSFPFRSIETLFLSVALFTLIVDVSLPVQLITLDRTAPYWCGYRVATYFHLLIFFSGFTTYGMFAFHKHFSSSDWNNTNIR
ncbi:MAG: hypothetical protein J0L69_04285 [Bacteroidetes bacterium]|nr:hypothetical protein [Bacteroidota bacterium]